MAGGQDIYHRDRRTYEPEVTPLDPSQRGKDPATHWRSGHVLRKIETPKWRTRESNFPLLPAGANLQVKWPISFGGIPSADMVTHAFETKPGSTAKFVGVTVPRGGRPDAYLLYFRHSARSSDYPGGAGLLDMGIGDYLEGRMQLSRQISVSGKRVAAVVPIAIGGSGEFETSEAFVRQALRDIDRDLYGGSGALPPLLLACNSDGITKMNKFIDSCPGLAREVKAIYDFDGSHLKSAPKVHSVGGGAFVIRYDGPAAARPNRGEAQTSFLARMMGAKPARVPLPYDRWGSGTPPHGRYKAASAEPADPKAKDPYRQERHNWLHHHIPTCMLTHALSVTPILK
ncbi:MAG TPA: hypothetical protein VGV17_14400 [Bosea sp. (in: a-proteobacteria)]|jgi:hypothetical protein|uniref:hypothetical protein n=1 Tax=Bosea sp. (in: a-proteobacteria) TaxID=1871050 RepID=UPI002DDD554F|nr:hypothetical protein [Bosea sp. (in: a-proteobacteria)]HEV2554944.1 hypothetical protein [Bosea sp. (in: a-proteobacteria)]